MRYCYIRTFRSKGDDMNSQRKMLSLYNCDEWVIDEDIPSDKENLNFKTLCDKLNKGDIVYITSFCRIASNLSDLIFKIESIYMKGAFLISILDDIDSRYTPLFSLNNSYCHFNNEQKKERQKKGLYVAHKMGKVGRKKTDLIKVSLIYDAYKENLKTKKLTIKELCNSFKIGRTTFYNYINMIENQREEKI